MGPNLEQLLNLKTPLQSAIDAFLIDRQARSLSPRTIEFYRFWLSRLVKHLDAGDIHQVEAVTAAALRAWFVQLADTHTPGGVHGAFRVARTFLLWYEGEYEPVSWSNPIRKLKPPRLPSMVLEPVPVADLKAMLTTCDRSLIGLRDRAALLCLLDSGCRAAEFLALLVGDVDLSTGTATVRRGKGGKGRVAFIGSKTMRELSRYLRTRGELRPIDPLWVTDEGAPLTYSGLRCMIRRRAARAGVKPPAVHAFRRSFALNMLRAGVHLVSLQRLMGHADLSTLRRYLAQTDADLRAEHGRGSPVDRLL